MRPRWLSPILGLSAVVLIFAQVCAEPSVNARVSATEVTLNSSLTLTVELQGIDGAGAAPNLDLPDFQVQRAGQTQSFQWINGQSSSLIAFNYVLTPTKTGTLQIPAITLSTNGKNYTTQPITVVVKPEGAASSRPATNENYRGVQVPSEGLRPLFMTASVDVDRAYVGQQVILRVQFLKRPDVQLTSQAQYNQPDLTGFLVEPLQQQEYVTSINGEQFHVTELPYALFPTSDGEFAIGSAQIQVAVRSQVDPFDPNSFFQNFFGRSDVARLSTRAIPVHVRALPKNKPVNFSGAVGRFKLAAKVDTNQPEVGKPLNLFVTIEGVGNIKTIKEPTLPDPKGFRRYETISTSHVSTEGKFLHGNKEFKTLLIPQVSGPLTIPSVSFSYFNPVQNEYVTEQSPSIELQVRPGVLNQGEPAVGAPAPPPIQAAEGVRVVEKDIRFIKSGKIRPSMPPVYLRGSFFAGALVPPLFALVGFVTRWRVRRRSENIEHYRSAGAYRHAVRQLKRARAQKMDDPVPFYSALSSALTGYLADKFSVPPAGLVGEEIEHRLTTANVDASLRKEVREILEEADMARFATASFSGAPKDAALQRCELLLRRLDEVL